ncbi:hypothetical protein CEV33_4429 [Brucella grignonensis]|uniref:Uncharacterized protein n=1 Tax=Brucella grignonensis TaxID=94627 RepID=A0A256FNK9_9HYPH|nr:hypothetical protein CEV33_4429 [Brucella grignonensis]
MQLITLPKTCSQFWATCFGASFYLKAFFTSTQILCVKYLF